MFMQLMRFREMLTFSSIFGEIVSYVTPIASTVHESPRSIKMVGETSCQQRTKVTIPSHPMVGEKRGNRILRRSFLVDDWLPRMTRTLPAATYSRLSLSRTPRRVNSCKMDPATCSHIMHAFFSGTKTTCFWGHPSNRISLGASLKRMIPCRPP
jgi:hypothetical protein